MPHRKAFAITNVEHDSGTPGTLRITDLREAAKQAADNAIAVAKTGDPDV